MSRVGENWVLPYTNYFLFRRKDEEVLRNAPYYYVYVVKSRDKSRVECKYNSSVQGHTTHFYTVNERGINFSHQESVKPVKAFDLWDQIPNIDL